MSDTTPRASDEPTPLADGQPTPVAEEEPTPLADETARELNTGEQPVRPSPDPADQTDTAAAPTLPPDYQPVSASEHVAPAPAPAVPAAAPAEAAESQTSAPAVPATQPAEADAAADTHATAATAHDARDADGAAAPETTNDAEPAAPASADGAPAVAESPAPPATQEAPAPSAPAEPTQQQASAPVPAGYSGATYLNVPTPPKKKSNRGLGILIAVLGAVIFALANAAATYGILSLDYGSSRAQTFLRTYLEGWEFWVPVAVFTGAFIALVAIVNRGRWWAYVLGSVFVAALVFVSYFAAALLTIRVWERTQDQFRSFTDAYFGTNLPYLWVAVAATFIALEVVIWVGGWIAFHGQNAKRRYAEAKAAYDAENSASR